MKAALFAGFVCIAAVNSAPALLAKELQRVLDEQASSVGRDRWVDEQVLHGWFSTSMVNMLVQRGHVLTRPSPVHESATEYLFPSVHAAQTSSKNAEAENPLPGGHRPKSLLIAARAAVEAQDASKAVEPAAESTLDFEPPFLLQEHGSLAITNHRYLLGKTQSRSTGRIKSLRAPMGRTLRRSSVGAHGRKEASPRSPVGRDWMSATEMQAAYNPDMLLALRDAGKLKTRPHPDDPHYNQYKIFPHPVLDSASAASDRVPFRAKRSHEHGRRSRQKFKAEAEMDEQGFFK